MPLRQLRVCVALVTSVEIVFYLLSEVILQVFLQIGMFRRLIDRQRL